MKGNIHKKLTREDKFARKFYCDHARLNHLRADKKNCVRQLRRQYTRETRRICESEVTTTFKTLSGTTYQGAERSEK